MIVKHVDSLTKIVEYLSRISTNSFTFNNKLYPAIEKFIISSTLFRRFECPEMCGGCCGRFTLDYFFDEQVPENSEKRDVIINGIKKQIHSYFQSPFKTEKKHCDFADEKGRCLIHEYNPFSCKMEPIKLFSMKNTIYLSKKPFGRGWAMTKCDGTKGALCKFHKTDVEKDFNTVIHHLEHLNKIADLFNLTTVLPKAIEYCKIQHDLFRTKEISEFSNFVLWDKIKGYYSFTPGMRNLF